jgi:hypothetical protein
MNVPSYHSPRSGLPKSSSEGKIHGRPQGKFIPRGQPNMPISNLQNHIQPHWMQSHNSQPFFNPYSRPSHQVRSLGYQKMSSSQSPYNNLHYYNSRQSTPSPPHSPGHSDHHHHHSTSNRDYDDEGEDMDSSPQLNKSQEFIIDHHNNNHPNNHLNGSTNGGSSGTTTNQNTGKVAGTTSEYQEPSPVEAESGTELPPEDPLQEKDPLQSQTQITNPDSVSSTTDNVNTAPRVTKADIIAQMNKTDSEIQHLEKELNQVLKQKDYYLTLFPLIPDSPPSRPSDIEPALMESSPFVNQIFNDSNHHRLLGLKELGHLYEAVPHSLYQEPSDLPFYEDNINSFESFKPILRAVLIRRKQNHYQKTARLQQEYADRWTIWREYSKKAEEMHKLGVMKLQQLESQNTRRTRGRRSIRKMLETPEEKRDTNTRFLDSLADIPPLILDEHQRKLHFKDNNVLIPNIEESEHTKRQDNKWGEEEEKSFAQLFQIHHKNFEQISALLPSKTTKDCVKFYYVNKKRLFKELHDEKPYHHSDLNGTEHGHLSKKLITRVMSQHYYPDNFMGRNHKSSLKNLRRKR